MGKETISYFRCQMQMVKDTEALIVSHNHIMTEKQAADIIKKAIWKKGQSDREQFVVLFLNGANRIIGVTITHTGTLNSCGVDPKEIFKAALLCNAASIIIGHNHPSERTNPSPDDIAVTKRIASAARLMNFNLLDHIIINAFSDDYYSFTENGIMPTPSSIESSTPIQRVAV